MRPSELNVIVKSKALCTYIFTVTEKSPKRFRFTLTGKLQTYALNLLEALYRANEVTVAPGDEVSAGERIAFQKQAQTELKLLGFMAQLAMEQKCILPKQYEQIAHLAHETGSLLGAWMKSDQKRYGRQPGPRE